MAPKASYGGIPLTGWRAVRWSLTAGARPDTREIIVPVETAEKVATVGFLTPQSLILEPDGEKPFEFEGIYLLAITGVVNEPFLRKIILTDRRYFWQLKHVHRGYNIRKRSAVVKALRLNANVPIEKAQLVGDFRWQAWSLKDGTSVWTIKEIWADLTHAVDPEMMFQLATESIVDLQLEEFEVDDDGATAIERLLHFLPGHNIKLTHRGLVFLYSEISDEEAPQIERAARHYVEVGESIIKTDRSRQRPQAINVLFTKEVELLFTYDESGTATKDEIETFARLLNVQRVPDVLMAHPVTGEELARGSWITIADYLTWVNTQERPARLAFGLPSLALFQKYRSSEFEQPAKAYCRDGGAGAYDPVWGARWEEWLVSWRHIFALTATARDRIYSFRPYRQSILSSEHGVRAPSDVWMNWISFPSDKGAVLLTQGEHPLVGDCFSTAGLARFGTSTCPYDLDVLDEENGILCIIPRRSAYGMHDMLVPGYPVDVANWTPRETRATLTALRYTVTLQAEHMMDVVLTVIQASPNNERRLWRHTVTPEQASAVLKRDVGPCTGPVMDVRIGPAGGWWTAKFAWSDSNAQTIRKSFFDDADVAQQDALASLLMNDDFVKGLAEAAAAKVYSEMLDRNEGHTVIPFNPDARLVGRLAHITHSMDTEGLCNTLLYCPPYRGGIDLTAWLPASMRKVLLRQVL